MAKVVSLTTTEETKLSEVFPMDNGKVTYSETVECGNITQAELFRRSRLWITQAVSDNKVLLADKDTGDMVSTGIVTVVLPRSEHSAGGIYNFRYNIVIECLNRKYRATISHIEIQEPNSKNTPVESFTMQSEKNQKELYTGLDKKLKELQVSLQQGVKEYKAF